MHLAKDFNTHTVSEVKKICETKYNKTHFCNRSLPSRVLLGTSSGAGVVQELHVWPTAALEYFSETVPRSQFLQLDF